LHSRHWKFCWGPNDWWIYRRYDSVLKTFERYLWKINLKMLWKFLRQLQSIVFWHHRIDWKSSWLYNLKWWSWSDSWTYSKGRLWSYLLVLYEKETNSINQTKVWFFLKENRFWPSTWEMDNRHHKFCRIDQKLALPSIIYLHFCSWICLRR